MSAKPVKNVNFIDDDEENGDCSSKLSDDDNDDDNDDDDPCDIVVQSSNRFGRRRGNNGNDEELCTKKLPCSIRPRMLRYCCIASALGGMLYGWEIGTFFGQEYYFYFGFRCRDDDDDCVPMSEEDAEYYDLLQIVLEGCSQVMGALVMAPILFDRYGRKPTMFWGAAINFVGALIQASSVNIPMMYAFRTFSMFGLGILNMVCPSYISELSPIHRRGQLTSTWFIGGTVGLVIAAIFDVFLRDKTYGWRLAFLGDMFICIAILGMLQIVPESHQFLLMKKRKDEARSVLKQVRASDESYDANNNAIDDIIELEIRQLEKQISHTVPQQGGHEGQNFCMSFRNLFVSTEYSPRKFLRLLYGVLLQIMNQLTGIRAISWYLVYLITDVHGETVAAELDIFLYSLNLIAGIFTFLSIERIGRPMILFSGGIAIFVLLVMAFLADRAIAGSAGGYPSKADAGFFLIAFIFYEMAYSFSWGPVSWVYCTEVFDIGTRGIGIGVTTASHAIAGATVRLLFIDYHSFFPDFYQFIAFMGTSGFSILFVYFLLPETSNLSMKEVGKEYMNHKPECVRMSWGPG